MAKPTKAAELRNLSNEEIEKELNECQRSLLKLRWNKAGRKVSRVSPTSTGPGITVFQPEVILP